MRYYSRHDAYRNWLGYEYPMVKLLMILNFGMYVLQWAFAFMDISLIHEHLVLSPRVWDGEIWQIGTYMFLHSIQDPFHIIFNMLALWMFGKELERVWGSREFLKYYLICGIGAGITFLFFSSGSVVGASGAVFGILLAFGMTFPDQIILMSFIFPVKAKYMVIFYGVITFFNIAKPDGGNVAHLAHLGGMVFGFFYIKREWFVAKRMPRPKPIEPKMSIRPVQTVDRQKELNERVDTILDKINDVGYDNLTAEEKAILLQASDRLSKKDRPDS